MQTYECEQTRDEDGYCSCGSNEPGEHGCEPFRVHVIEPSDYTENGPDTWLWCMYCTTFFQEQHIGTDARGRRERCPFCCCMGLGVAIFPWRAHRSSSWPDDEKELRVGAKSPD